MRSLSLLASICLVPLLVDCATLHVESEAEPKQSWAYVTVRPKAHMFYWLYQTTHSSGYKNRPLILWLQGGPGGSSTGFGNFGELGPLDTDLKPRNTTWLQTASLLFIDNPVGSGYSYVEEGGKFTTNVAEISADLLTCMQTFIKKNPDFKKVPFYIFSESYGGKMTAAFSAVLYDAVKAGKIDVKFKGFAMGDSWISPVDSVKSWPSYLYGASLIDAYQMAELDRQAQKIEKLVEGGEFSKATNEWSNMENLVESETGGVNFYNIMKWIEAVKLKHGQTSSEIDRLYQRHVGVYHNGDLNELMNGPIKRKLKIIPDDVTWGGQSREVFSKQYIDFMKNVTSTVNQLINETPLTVVTYEGQLDLICDFLGADMWFRRLDIAPKFQASSRQLKECEGKVACYYQQTYKNAQFYWILDAGHMVPSDNGYGALAMVNKVIEPYMKPMPFKNSIPLL